MSSKQTVDVVVARHTENLDWIKQLKFDDPSRPSRLFVYDKSTSQQGGTEENTTSPPPPPPHHHHHHLIERLPNVGREANTFLHHIVKHYHDLADETIFLQGHPFDHCVDLPRLQGFVDGKADYSAYASFDIVTLQPHFVDQGPQYDAIFDVVYSTSRPFLQRPQQYRFSSGAQYVVKREAILQHSEDVWRTLLGLSISDERLPWNIERLWMYIYSTF